MRPYVDALTPAQSQKFFAERMINHSVPIQRASWQGVEAPCPVYELPNVIGEFDVPDSITQWQGQCEPDLPWAEEHFQERVCGSPLNPPPSSARWPWYSETERQRFLNGSAQRFDHTYPERYWPKNTGYAGEDRTFFGDLQDVVQLLTRDPWTRQAYLPIWFPEDTGSTQNQRVPCSLGYHFIRNGPALDCNYFIRSCDLTRHYHNDLYLTGRLLQWVVDQIPTKDGYPFPGKLTIFISNLHLFVQDKWRFQ